MLFDIPVPTTVVDDLEALVGGRVQHLRGLGLVDAIEDLVDHRQVAVAINALAAGRLSALSDRERDTLVNTVARPLFLAWGGVALTEKRPFACDLQLTVLGLSAEDGEIVGACAARAVFALNSRPAIERSELGKAAIELLDAQHRALPLRLLSETAKAVAFTGDGQTADLLLARGAALVAEQQAVGFIADPMAAAFLLHEQAKRLMTRGDLDQARFVFEQTAKQATAAGNEISAVIARGNIADILEIRGELDEALGIRQEEELPVYERLGDVRSRAITIGQIADILARRGDTDEALRLRQEEQLPVLERLGDVRAYAVAIGKIAAIFHRRGDLDKAHALLTERLDVNRRLGDADGIANALWGLAQLELDQKNFEKAAPRVIEAYDIVSRLGRADGIAAVGLIYGQFLAASQMPEEALTALTRSAEMFRRLGREKEALYAEKLINELGLSSISEGKVP